jgi:hypothetical protein
VELRLLERLFTPKEAKLAVYLTLNREKTLIIARRAPKTSFFYAVAAVAAVRF